MFAAFTCITTSTPCWEAYKPMSAQWGCIDCMRFVFSSPLPGCPSPPPPALLDLPERLLELVLRMKVLGPVSRLYAAGTAIEPF